MISMELQSLLEEMGCVVIGPVPSVAEAVVVSRTVELDAAIVDVVLRGGGSLSGRTDTRHPSHPLRLCDRFNLSADRRLEEPRPHHEALSA
jgi:hypothetical protein